MSVYVILDIPMGVYRCCCSLMNVKFLRFQYVKNKARDIRLFHIWFPRRLRNAFREACPVASVCHQSAWFAVQIYIFPVYLAKKNTKKD